MRCVLFYISLFLVTFIAKSQQVGVGTLHPNANAILDINDSTRGVLLPRISTTARLNLPNIKGMIVFDTGAEGYWYNDGSGWINLPSKSKSAGDMLYWNGNQWTSIPAGLGGQVLTLSTGTHIPSWKGPTSDTVFTDPRDGQQYGIKQYGSQIWMTKNLNYSGGLCYNYSSSNCNIYGKLYSHYEALSAVPPGWHLPSDAEWDTLINFLGGANVAGGAMKSVSALWNAPNTGATNSSGFSALPGGWFYEGYVSFFNFIGQCAFFWSSTYSDTVVYSTVRARLLFDNTTSVQRVDQPWMDKLSVRCIKDN